MPFRTCLFYGDPGPEVLTPLMAQQMAGRAGRRGLDRQGHLVYANISWSRVQDLVIGKLPEITGSHPLYPTIALQTALMVGRGQKSSRLQQICATPLAEYLRGDVRQGYYNQSTRWMERMEISFTAAKANKRIAPQLVAEAVWQVRLYFI